MKKELRGISITTVMDRKDAGNGHEAMLSRFIDRKTGERGIILMLMRRGKGGVRTIAVSDPVMDGEAPEYAFLDASADDIYASAEIRNLGDVYKQGFTSILSEEEQEDVYEGIIETVLQASPLEVPIIIPSNSSISCRKQFASSLYVFAPAEAAFVFREI